MIAVAPKKSPRPSNKRPCDSREWIEWATRRAEHVREIFRRQGAGEVPIDNDAPESA